MRKNIFSWGKSLPMLGVGLLVAGLLSFVGGGTSSAHNGGGWNGETKYFLKLAGVPGGSADAKHAGEIELTSYRFLENEPDVSADELTAAAAAADFGDNNLRFQADASKASPLLFAKATSGETIADATLSVRKGKNANDYLVFKMTDVVVSSYQNNGNGDQNPMDEVVLDYATLEITHNEGTVLKKGWNFKEKAAL